MQSNDTSPQSNTPQLPGNIQHDEEGPFLIVEGFGKFRLANATAASAIDPTSRKPDIPIEPPIPAPVSPIEALPVAVPDPISEPPAEAPAKASKSVVKAKPKKKKTKVAVDPTIPVTSSGKKCNRELESLGQLNQVSRMEIDDVQAPCRKRSRVERDAAKASSDFLELRHANLYFNFLGSHDVSDPSRRCSKAPRASCSEDCQEDR